MEFVLAVVLLVIAAIGLALSPLARRAGDVAEAKLRAGARM
jgi:hypothetical protein